jgi:hypothetical protein
MRSVRAGGTMRALERAIVRAQAGCVGQVRGSAKVTCRKAPRASLRRALLWASRRARSLGYSWRCVALARSAFIAGQNPVRTPGFKNGQASKMEGAIRGCPPRQMARPGRGTKQAIERYSHFTVALTVAATLHRLEISINTRLNAGISLAPAYRAHSGLGNGVE